MVRVERFVMHHASGICASVVLAAMVYNIWRREFANAIALMPMVLLLFWQRQALNTAFQLGWSASARSTNETLKELVTDQQRMMLWLSSTAARPSYQEYLTQLEDEMAEAGPAVE